MLARGRWFSPASSTTKTGRHDIAEILLKVALKHQKSNQINSVFQRILCDNLDTKAQTSLSLVSSLVQLWICILVSIWWLIQMIQEFSLLLRIKKKIFSPLQPKYFESQGAVCRKLNQHWLIDCLTPLNLHCTMMLHKNNVSFPLLVLEKKMFKILLNFPLLGCPLVPYQPNLH